MENELLNNEPVAIEKKEIQERITSDPKRFNEVKTTMTEKTANAQRLDKSFERYRGKMLTSLEASALTGDALVAMKKIFKGVTGELWNEISKILVELELKNSINGVK